jgi:hypothetical protein
MEVSGQLHAPAALPPGEEPREKIPAPFRAQTPDHPARSPALYHWVNRLQIEKGEKKIRKEYIKRETPEQKINQKRTR